MKNIGTSVQNKSGEWVPAIPEPYYHFIRKECYFPKCHRKFWTNEGYEAHYALKHILDLCITPFPFKDVAPQKDIPVWEQYIKELPVEVRVGLAEWSAEQLLSVLEKQKEIVICAAVRMPDGYVIRGHRHGDCIATYNKIPKYKGVKTGGNEHGFVTSRNRFVTRSEGCRIQKAAGIKSRLELLGGQAYLYGELYSEDLY